MLPASACAESWKNICRVSEYARKFQADYAEKPMNRLRRTKEEIPGIKDRLAQMEAFMLPGDWRRVLSPRNSNLGATE